MVSVKTLRLFFVVLVSISLIEASRKKCTESDSSSDEREFIEANTRVNPATSTGKSNPKVILDPNSLRRSPRAGSLSNPFATQNFNEPTPHRRDPCKPVFTLSDVVTVDEDFDLKNGLLGFQSRVNGLNESFSHEELDVLKTKPILWDRSKGETDEDIYEIDERGRKVVKFDQLEEEHLTMEDQVNPQNNPISRIMAQYRRDLGFNPVRPFLDEVGKEEVLGFMKCLGASEQELSKVPYSKLREMYDFLKYLGIIPHYEGLTVFTPQICAEITESAGFSSLSEMMECYEDEFNLYTFLNWEYVDLTHFKNQDFKIVDRIIKNLEQNGNYGGNGLFTVKGRAILSQVAEQIRFHNPRTIEGRRMLLFQGIYRLYRKYKKARREPMHPSFIDWDGCDVKGWPTGMDRNDLTQWTFEQINEMEQIIANDDLEFVPSRTFGNGFLGWVPGFDEGEIINADAIRPTRRAECPISDDEEVCGNGSFRKNYEKLTREHGNLEPVYNRETEEFVKKVSADLRKKKRGKTLSLDTQISDKKKNKSPKPRSPKKSPKATASTSATSGPVKRVKNRNIVFYKKDGYKKPLKFEVKPADWGRSPPEAEREALLENIREMYHEDTGLEGEIDWSRAQVLKLEYHELPFDPKLETVNDVKIVKHLMKNYALAFLNSSESTDRKIHLYERLYEMYVQATDLFAHPFDIYAEVEQDGVFVRGWPEHIEFNLSEWTDEDVDVINGLLERNEISFELTPEKRAELEEARRKFDYSETTGNELVMSEVVMGSPHSSDTSENSSIAAPTGNGLISHCAQSEFASPIQTTTQNTPGFANYVNHRAYSNGLKRKGNKPSDEDAHRDKLVKGFDDSINVTSGAFEGNTYAQVNEFGAKIQRYTEETTQYRDQYPKDSRQNRIYSEILKCFGLLHAHAYNPITAKLSLSEIHRFLEMFTATLNSVAEDGTIDEEVYRIFIINATKLRVRLAGFTYNRSGQKFLIPRSRFVDFDQLGFLLDSESRWDVNLLEYYLYTPGVEIFT